MAAKFLLRLLRRSFSPSPAPSLSQPPDNIVIYNDRPSPNPLIVASEGDLLPKIIKENPIGITRRDAHPKMHGVVKAECIIERDMPEEVRVGIFNRQVLRDPARECARRIPGNPGDDFLREGMIRQLAIGDALFDFTVQLQVNAEAMPIRSGQGMG